MRLGVNIRDGIHFQRFRKHMLNAVMILISSMYIAKYSKTCVKIDKTKILMTKA